VDLGFDDRSDDRPCPVDGTELLLREALANLVDNAIRYAGRGASVTVRVTAVPHQRVRVEVEDNGPGVPEAERERVFERFVRGDTQVATGVGDGCGLGLAIVREVVQRHGGTVWLEAVAPRGVRACIELPAAAPQG
jgi:two-component system, OmpR family, sensor histidine kinase TctE